MLTKAIPILNTNGSNQTRQQKMSNFVSYWDSNIIMYDNDKQMRASNQIIILISNAKQLRAQTKIKKLTQS